MSIISDLLDIDVEILDISIFEDIHPKQLEECAFDYGWKLQRRFPDGYSVWLKKEPGVLDWMQIPARKSSNHARIVAGIVRRIAFHARKSQLRIYAELKERGPCA